MILRIGYSIKKNSLFIKETIFLTYKLLKANNKINEEKYSKKIFAFSILYLFLIFSLLLIESFFKIF